MDPAVQRTIEEVLNALLREYDERVPGTGSFPTVEVERPLPGGYGPEASLALEAEPFVVEDEQPIRHRRIVKLKVIVGGGWIETAIALGSKSEVREQLRSPEVVVEVGKHLDPYYEARAVWRPLEVPVVRVEQDNEPCAVLDPRSVEFSRWTPHLGSHDARWKLFWRLGETWIGGGVVATQSESNRSYLEIRVRNTLDAFDGLERDGFRFRVRDGPAPEAVGEHTMEDLDSTDPLAARLRQICAAVIHKMPNAEESTGLHHAFRSGAEHVLDVRDQFDGSHYYVPIPPGCMEVERTDMQQVLAIVHRDEFLRRVDIAG